jgi:hypothetical protein
MANQKPVAAEVRKPIYSAAETKKIGAGNDYDKIAFANKTIDNLRSRTNSLFSAHMDVVPVSSPEAQAMIPKKAGRDAWVADAGYYEPNKRNQTISNVFEAKSPLTGQVGMSRSQYNANAADIKKYGKDETADTNVRFKRKK